MRSYWIYLEITLKNERQTEKITNKQTGDTWRLIKKGGIVTATENTGVTFNYLDLGQAGRASTPLMIQIPLAQAYLPPSKVLLQLEEASTFQ